MLAMAQFCDKDYESAAMTFKNTIRHIPKVFIQKWPHSTLAKACL